MWDQIPVSLPIWLVAVAAGGAISALVGSRYLSDQWMRGIPALLLIGSVLKLVFS